MSLIGIQLGITAVTSAQPTSASTAIRRFRIDVPQAELVELRQRIAATRWPDQQTVSDRS